MPDRKAYKNYNISITEKEEIVKECISEITKQFFEKIELISKQISENVNKQYEEEITALKLEITQLKKSQNFLSNKYDKLKNLSKSKYSQIHSQFSCVINEPFFINENLTNTKKNFFGKRSKKQEN